MANPKSINGLKGNIGSATATSGAATCNETAFKITSESLTTAAAGEYTLTLTNKLVNSGSIVLYSVDRGTSTQATMACGEARVGAGQVVMTVTNTHASEAFNGTIVIRGIVINATGV